MSPDDAKRLEDRIETYCANLPELFAHLLYRQLNRQRGIHMDMIDQRIRALTPKCTTSPGCTCSGKHPTNVPFSHWIAEGDQ